MTSAISPAHQTPSIVTSSASAPSHSTSDETTPLPAVPAQLPTKPSYAHATKSASTSSTTTKTALSSTPTPTSATGPSAPVQHGKIDDTDSKRSMSTTSPSVGPQQGVANTHINGISRTDSHGRKPSVVISASGATGHMPNGGPVGQNASRPHISFGSMMDSQASPAQSNAQPFYSQHAALATPQHNPRIISPAHSPTPIPQPPASGGKPPAGLQQHGNPVNFGSMGTENADGRQAPLTPSQQPAHLNRDSSQSGHGDMGGPGMHGMGRGFMPSNGRGRGGHMPPYGSSSPAQNYRSMQNQRGPPSMPSQFQQGQQSPMGSQYRGGRGSPAPMHPQPHAPHNMPNGSQMSYGGYPQHLNPQQHNNMYGMQPPYDAYSGYYQPFYPHQQYPGGGPPASPRPGQQYPQSPYGAPSQHMPSPYHPPSMSRSASQISERPASSLGSRPPTNASATSQAPTPAPASTASAAPSSNFQIPSRNKSKAIVIKNAQGEEVHFDKKPTPSPGLQPQTPAIVSSTTPTAPTPPPRTPSVQHNRTESKSAMTDAEIKTGFQEQVKRQLEAQREQERKDKQDADQKVTATQQSEAEDKAKADKDKAEAESNAEAEKKAAAEKERLEAETKAKKEQEKSDAEAKAKADQEKSDAEAKAKAEQEKSNAEAKAKAEQEKSDAEAKADAEKERLAAEAKANADKEKSDAEAAAQADNARAVTDAEKAAAPKPEEDEAARFKREEDERIEREIEEMEAAERAEEERERKYQEKKARDNEEKKKREAEKAAVDPDEEMKRLEREAEERELAREKEREHPTEESAQAKADRDLFASLKRPALGPGATAPTEAEPVETPVEEETPAVEAPEAAAVQTRGAPKPKPLPLKLQTDRPVEPAAPTPGMQALKSARILNLQRETINYPDGIKSPNPALNSAAKRGGKSYDKSFLLQFQEVFKEKPTMDWDQKVKETLGEGEPSSARVGAGRTPSSAAGRQPSNRPPAPSNFGGAMGSFAGPRTLPPNSTSAERFAMSQGGPRPAMGNPMASFSRPAGAFPMGSQPSSRNASMQGMAASSQSSPRGGAARGGRGGSRRGPDRDASRKGTAADNKTMPLTAGMELQSLEKSATGWTARSIGQPVAAASAVGPDGIMPPDMVQRKVKAALNKMTPEKFDKISDQVIEIANQSKSESDGRTLRQVIQLTFEKACDEAHWAGMYAKFCQKMLTTMSNDIIDETIRDKAGNPVVGGGLFRKYLLNRCQEEFERGWEVNLPDKPEGETEEAALLSDEYYIAAAAKRKGLGLIQFIGELYKLSMLTYRIMHQCVLKLLDFEGTPDESAVENLCRLLRTIGATMDHSDKQGHDLVNIYFGRINNIMEQNKDMPSRPRFMLMDVLDLRRSGWQDKSAQKGPKTIQEIRAEAEAAAAAAEAEKARQHTRGGPGGGRMPAGRGDARHFGNPMPPPDYPRNQVGMDDLRKLQNRQASSRQASSGLGPSLGPGSSLYAGRSGSGRKGPGLGPPKDSEASGAGSRTGTPPAKKEDKEPNTHANAFSALAALENEGTEDARSPPSEKASPQATKATPSAESAAAEPTTSS